MDKNSLTQAELKKSLRYDPLTGIFIWLRTHSNRAVAGSVAGVHSRGRVQIRIDGYIYLAHRLAWLWMTGKWPPDQIDHIDMSASNNRWDNLRLATNQQNKGNLRAYKNNSIGEKGIRFQAGRYEAHITINRRQVYLGRHDTVGGAREAYWAAAQAHFGEFARAG